MEFLLLIVVFLMLLVFVPYMMNKRAVVQVIKRLRKQQALDAESAKTITELGLNPPSFKDRLMKVRDYKPAALQGLMRVGIVQMTEDGRVYLSEERLKNSKLSHV
ncbi:MAG: hypothetical protein C4530_16870 [Desulfobacteraceae bacterium]|jgi:hypothetical protein|nr:MAG: hypothetical protein C4530_16870 [Desulfobacteraceae bacterium]